MSSNRILISLDLIRAMGLFSAKCLSTSRLDGKTAIITGSNTGIGKCTVQDFYQRGARVVMACRDTNKANKAAEEIRRTCEGELNVGQLIVTKLDLSDLKSVRKCAKDLLENERRIDLLINNAGVMLCPKSQTIDGFETHFGTNHLGHFLFTLLLLPKIRSSTPARIVNVSSVAHTRGNIDFNDLQFTKRPYNATQAYCQSKLANILFTTELAKKVKDEGIEGVTMYSLHPGIIRTELGRHLDKTYFWGASFVFRKLFGFFIKTPVQGSQTTIYCALDESAGKESGLYYAECKVKEPSVQAKQTDDAARLWNVSLELVGLKNNGIF